MKKNLHGFTLMELLIVIAILGILVTVGLTSFMSSQKKSRDLKRKNELRQISTALEAYYNDKKHYPASSINGEIMGCYHLPTEDDACVWGEIFADINNTVYMVTLPVEIGDMRYMYIAPANGSSYQLYTRMENTLADDIPKNAQDQARVFSDINCSSTATSYCNFGVASSNVAVETGRTVSYE